MTGWPDPSRALGLLFVMTFVGVAGWEIWKPSRATIAPLTRRWFGNFTLFGMTAALAWLLPILSSSAAASVAARHGWGIFHLFPIPPVIALVASLVALDLAAYWTHRLFHGAHALWRLHALHHSDSDLDVTTALRHHPGEVLVQMSVDTALAFLFGFPPLAIVLYAGLVLVVQTFHHGNVVLPPRLKWLDRYLVTPDLHRLHHSALYTENNSNFGNLVPLWDHLFGTLRHQPEGDFRVGLPDFPGADFQRLDRLLIQPLLVTAQR